MALLCQVCGAVGGLHGWGSGFRVQGMSAIQQGFNCATFAESTVLLCNVCGAAGGLGVTGLRIQGSEDQSK